MSNKTYDPKDGPVKTLRITTNGDSTYALADEIFCIELFPILNTETEVTFKFLPKLKKEDLRFILGYDIETTFRTLQNLQMKATIKKIREVNTNQKTSDIKMSVSLTPDGDYVDVSGIIAISPNKAALKIFGIEMKICKINDIIHDPYANTAHKVLSLFSMIEDHIKYLAQKNKILFKEKESIYHIIENLCHREIIDETIKNKAHTLRDIRNKAHKPDYDITREEFNEFKTHVFDIMIVGEDVRIKNE